MNGYEDDCERLARWVASLRKTSAATRSEAERRGAAWEFYTLSLSSADAQEAQAADLEQKLNAIQSANRRWSP